MMPDQNPEQPVSQSSSQELLEDAATWLVIMSSDECTEEERKAFWQWQQQDPRHAQIVEQLQATLGQFTQLQDQHHKHNQVILEQTLESQGDEASIWRLRSILFFVTSAVLMAVVAWQILPVQYWVADHQNSYQQWTEQRLSDYSQIKTSGKTAYDVDFDQQQRLISLYQGNILVDVGKDAKRPFVVHTEYAKITALGTRFIVRQYGEQTILTMLSSKTQVVALAQPATHYTLQAGQQMIINAEGVQSVTTIPAALIEQAWQQRVLVVQNMPLDQLLKILQNYQSETLLYDAQRLHAIAVNATLPLDGSALVLLENSLPIGLEHTWFGRTKINPR
jgi:transmembrane sensor